MKTIIVPTDFSAPALNAANYAADMAEAIHTDILLLHVCHLPVAYSEIGIAFDYAKMQNDAEIKIGLFKKQLTRYKDGTVIVRTEIRIGDFFSELKFVCERIKPYAVIMGSQGSTAAARFFFGEHTVYAMKHLKWPLITVSPDVKYSSIKNIAIACDLHDVHETIPVEEIRLLIKDFKARLHIINAGRNVVYDPDPVFQSGMLQEMFESIHPEYHFITYTNADKGIIECAKKNKIDLLIVIPKKHDILEKVIRKSHTRQMVLNSPVPVMALHA